MGCQHGTISGVTSRYRHSKDIVEAETLENFDARSRYSHRPVEQDVIVGHDDAAVLGEGCNGVVTRVVNRFTGQPCALKVLDKTTLCRRKLDNLRAEVNNYLKIDHPHIARLLHVYEDNERVCLVMELCAGKELFDRVALKKQFTEHEARKAAFQMLLAVAYLHKHNIVHCDLKLDNFLYDRDTEGGILKLIDFGFSKVWNHRVAMRTQQGTESYTAPEVFHGCYTDKCDMWSLGVVIFILLGGYSPFPMDSSCQKYIMQGKYKFKEDRWKNVSPGALDFVRKLLVVDPELRMSADECLSHDWMKDLHEATTLTELSADAIRSAIRKSSKGSHVSVDVSSQEIIVDMQQYSQCSHLKRAALAMMAHHLSSVEMEEMRNAFLALDADHTGAITRGNFHRALDGLSALDADELDRLFDCANFGHDNEIHYSEFVAAMMQSRIDLTQELVYECFELFDVSRTGVITTSDLKSVFGGTCFEDAHVDTLISECGGCTPSTGITFERFYRHMLDADKHDLATTIKVVESETKEKKKRPSLTSLLRSSSLRKTLSQGPLTADKIAKGRTTATEVSEASTTYTDGRRSGLDVEEHTPPAAPPHAKAAYDNSAPSIQHDASLLISL